MDTLDELFDISKQLVARFGVDRIEDRTVDDNPSIDINITDTEAISAALEAVMDTNLVCNVYSRQEEGRIVAKMMSIFDYEYD